MAKTSLARKARIRARNQAHAAEQRRIEAELRAQGHSCSTCKHKGYRMAAQMVCELGSDFHGYQPVKPDYICSQFEAA